MISAKSYCSAGKVKSGLKSPYRVPYFMYVCFINLFFAFADGCGPKEVHSQSWKIPLELADLATL